MNVLINALPMTVVGTGIGRTLHGLAAGLAALAQDDLRVSWFTGDGVLPVAPIPRGPALQERIMQLLWRMPEPVAYGVRLLRHARTEARFNRVAAGFDVYHEAGYFPLKAGAGLRTILTVHDLSLFLHPQWHPRERVRYFRKFFIERFSFADRFCAVSEFTKGEMVRHLGIDPRRITVTRPGFDPALFNREEDREAQRFIDGAGVPPKFLLFVGSGDPRKNLQAAVAAVQRTRNRRPLVTVGWRGWHYGVSEGVINLGYVPDRVLAQLYRRTRLLIMPSEYEGFGLPVLEAMACGCPVLTSTAGALLEVGGDVAATMDDVHDTKGFAKKIDELLDCRERRVTMGEAGYARAQRYSRENMARETVRAWAGEDE